MNVRLAGLCLVLMGCGDVVAPARDASIDAVAVIDAAADGCVNDCAGVCGGTATVDRCGVCDADPSTDCKWPDNATATCISGGVRTGCPSATDLGQDGNYQIHVPVYVTTDDTATDPITGLEWERNPPYVDVDNAPAVAACEGLTLAGQSDWRLPSRLELASLVDAGTIVPPFQATTFPGIPQNSNFWTSTPNPGNANERFVVNTNYPVWSFASTSTNLQVFRRCVRGAPLTGMVLAVGMHVEDGRTNLSWEGTPAAGTLDWARALAYCEGLALDGFADWRLPSLKELTSIVDDQRSNPAIATVFAGRPGGAFWSSTPLVTQASASPGGYALDFTSGTSSGIETGFGTLLQVRCVR